MPQRGSSSRLLPSARARVRSGASARMREVGGDGPVRFALFDVENLFARPRAFNQATWAQGQPILDAFATFNSLIELAAYSAGDKTRMIELLVQLDVYRQTNGIVRRNRTPPRSGRGCGPTAARLTWSTPTPASRSSPAGGAAGLAGWSLPPSPSMR